MHSASPDVRRHGFKNRNQSVRFDLVSEIPKSGKAQAQTLRADQTRRTRAFTKPSAPAHVHCKGFTAPSGQSPPKCNWGKGDAARQSKHEQFGGCFSCRGAVCEIIRGQVSSEFRRCQQTCGILRVTKPSSGGPTYPTCKQNKYVRRTERLCLQNVVKQYISRAC